jgi:TetR/AcrR family fatty acid metabolism transcriptional regulator
MSKSGDPIRQQVIEARRSQILEAAAQVFSEKGYHRANTKEIAEQAGISEGTIYNYFIDKADLLINMLNFLTAKGEWEQQFDHMIQNDFRTSTKKIFRDSLMRGRSNDRFSSVILSEILINTDLRERYRQQYLDPLSKVFEQYIQMVIESGQMRSIDVPLTVRVIFAAFIGLQVLRIIGDPALKQENDSQLAEVLSVIFSDGFAV